ncbi:hypothetical protein Clacol_006295 [Clathrus columnatus]|uniref:BD-FAE-like domain-containing protein n=1 Tax=Clathrus columnatus TaxID=1419009 RepID=A0AAV5AH97_9AGAM|nr:hypothetical protein Clacol_006295 [Clathrus columnatus]
MTSEHHHPFIDLYADTETSDKPLVVFIHGGAWRSESKDIFQSFALHILDEVRLPVAVLDYRLSTKHNNLKHPGHAEDVLDELEKLVEWPTPLFDRSRLYLVGHSAGAHILSSIFLDSEVDTLQPSDALLYAVQGILVASGIFDPETLLDRFPNYDFIPQVFTGPYSRWNTLNYTIRSNMPPSFTRWHVVHSSGDTLVNVEQSEAMFNHIHEAYAKENWDTGLISKDYDTLTIGHYYTTKAPFASLVGAWAMQDIQNR